jgi:hypothetical protein
MAHPLNERIGAIRRRVRTLVLVHALSWLVATVVATIVALGLLDYLIHFQDRGIRTIASLAVLGVAAAVLYRYVWTALVTQLNDVELALRVERRFPELKGRLASTIQFLGTREDDPEAGSAALRRHVVAETVVQAEPLDFGEAVDARAIALPTLVAAAVCLLAGACYFVAPESSQLALARLANPFGDTAWPKVNHLAFKQPVGRVALGQRFEVELVDQFGEELPADARIHFRFEGAGQEAAERSEPMKMVGGAVLASIEQVSRPFAYRATGGDDDSMEWRQLEVIEPPAVTELSATLHYPAYTGWASTTTNDPHLRALAGTKVALSAKTTKPLRSAKLKIEGGGKEPAEIVAKINDDGYGFSIPVDAEKPLVIQASGAYTLDLEDREGFHGGQGVRYDLRAIEDRAPTIAIEQPAADTYVTADAVVPLRFLAKDDLAIQSVSLHVERSDKSDQGETVTVLYEGPKQMTAPAGTTPGSSTSGENRVVEHRWELGPLGLKQGTRLTIHASASDYQPVVTHSAPRRLSIISPLELQDRLAERQGAVLNELSRILKLERESRAQVGELKIQLDQVGKLAKQDTDHLQQAELTQRQVQRALTSPTEGIRAPIEGLLADLKNNKVEGADVERRMKELLKEVGRLADADLPVVARELTSALKDAQSAQGEKGSQPSKSEEAKTKERVGDSLAKAGEHQDNVVQSLEQMLGDLSEWDNYRRFHRDIGQMRREQEELNRDTAALGAKTVTKDFKDLDNQQQADLKRLGSRQNDLARDFDKIQQRMEAMQGQLKESDPLAADTIADALHQARQQAVGGQMREAGRNVEQNQVGQAAGGQQQVMKSLDELLDILANRHERELDRLVKRLRESEQELSQLRKEQAGLRKKMQDAAKIADEKERKRELERLSKEQKKLQDEVERFARKLKRLQAEQASRMASKGGSKMGRAGQQGEQGDGQGAAEQAAAAEKDLDDAQQQLAQERKKAEEDLAREQVARMEDTVNALKQQQEKLLVETKHYDDLQQKNGRLTRAESLSVRDLARQQQLAKEETEGLAKKLSSAEVFELALNQAARDMAKAAERLEQRDTSSPTQRTEQRAIARLEQLVKSFKSDPKDKQEQQQQQGGEGGGGQGGQGQRSLSELKLLKLMQESLNERTRTLEEAYRKAKTLTPNEQQEYAELSEEQGRLADLLLDLTKPPPEEKDDHPLKEEKKAKD